MSTARILIAYATSHGQTAKIARYMADRFTDAGDSVTIVDAGELSRNRDLPHGQTMRDFDAVVIGASVLYGRHQRSARAFARAHHDALNAMPSAFYSVSGSASGEDTASQAEARRLADAFHRETGWHPQVSETVAGAMAYTRYSPPLRWVLKRISARRGGPVDTRRDHEMTDWAQVRRIVSAVDARVHAHDGVTVPAPA